MLGIEARLTTLALPTRIIFRIFVSASSCNHDRNALVFSTECCEYRLKLLIDSALRKNTNSAAQCIWHIYENTLRNQLWSSTILLFFLRAAIFYCSMVKLSKTWCCIFFFKRPVSVEELNCHLLRRGCRPSIIRWRGLRRIKHLQERCCRAFLSS